MTSAPSPIEPGPTGQSEPSAPPVPSGPPVDGGREVSLAVALLIYTALRVLLVAVLTALLVIFMPLIVALLFAFVLQLPLAWVLFGKWRRQVNDSMSRATATRRSERARLQGALSGDPSALEPAAPDSSGMNPSGMAPSPADPPRGLPTAGDRVVTDSSVATDRPAGRPGS